ncbi:hypothetical protein PG993_007065 [Apiospora rasikravindrae]|uniref:2EXR domain-containing protein n=1 Tax=Apiospora rasikravindrae TaxID=990691 RepID=A0ABR1SWE5_9PEZI
MEGLQCTKFHPFALLPPEIRRMIWDCVVEQPRVIETRGFYDHDAKRWAVTGDALSVFPRFPSVHAVCHESRRAFLESPGLVSEEGGLGVAWHSDRDILKCYDLAGHWNDDRGWEASWWDDIGWAATDTYYPPGLPGRRDVQHLQFDLSTFYKAFPVEPEVSYYEQDICRSWTDVERNVLDRFPNVKTVELVADDEFRSSPRDPRSFEVTLSFPSRPVDMNSAWAFINGLRDSWYQGFSLNIKGKMVCRVKGSSS